MQCKYSDFEGRCQMFDPEADSGLGVDEEGEGYCVCEDDPEPSNSCEGYEPLDDQEDEEDDDWDVE
ncbi:MAG: hypothetical protein HOG49_15125 [Candidatus Scalindua sp.]|jgi:hypothetical protein|nr:hypothetical protein [Candidatus Scalindua sp.]